MRPFLFALVLAACASRPPAYPALTLVGTDGIAHDLRATAAAAKLTVFVFFAPSCSCLKIHEPRLLALFDEHKGRGVQMFMVDSEAGASPSADADEARRRGYPFAMLTDRGAKLANALGADYATYAVVVDAEGRVRYHGGIDSDEMRLRDDATPYLRDAIEDLLAGREPRVVVTRALGCSLTKW